MINIRQEGGELKNGINLMWSPWVQVYFCFMGKNFKFVSGVGFSRLRKKFNWIFTFGKVIDA